MGGGKGGEERGLREGERGGGEGRKEEREGGERREERRGGGEGGGVKY